MRDDDNSDACDEAPRAEDKCYTKGRLRDEFRMKPASCAEPVRMYKSPYGGKYGVWRLATALKQRRFSRDDREWSGRNAVPLSAGINGIYLSRANLDVAFDDSGRQINPLTARLTGNVAGVMKLFNRCGWLAEPESGSSLPHQYSLMARQGVPRKGD